MVIKKSKPRTIRTNNTLFRILCQQLRSLLQMKKDSDWVQPSTQKTTKEPPTLSAEDILAVAKQVPEANINGWEDIDLLDVRPTKGVTKVRAKSRWEIQVDHQTGEIAQVAKRRSDLIEQVHDGSFFGNGAKMWLFFPAGVVLLILWISGGYLIAQPYWAQWQRAKKRQRKATEGLSGKMPAPQPSLSETLP